ncbi:MAG: hypothetical protein QF886_26145, partial [Planctomycetota bacterium]|nr:hypothetical protein [Planctomycetota bacterium]
MSETRLGDDEVVYRRIPPGSQWFEPPDRISSFNFKLRSGETGLSVYRAGVVSDAEILKRPEAVPGSLVACATVDGIRQLKDGLGRTLGLDVVACDDEDNPGHAEIRGPLPGKLKASSSRALKKLFELQI